MINVNEHYDESMRKVMTSITNRLKVMLKSRANLQDHLNEINKDHVSLVRVNNWFQASRPDMVPNFRYLIQMCLYVGDLSILGYLFSPYDYDVLPKDMMRFIDIGKTSVELAKLVGDVNGTE